MARIALPKKLQTTKVIGGGRIKTGDMVVHPHYPDKPSKVQTIFKHTHEGKHPYVRIYLEDGRDIDPLYCVKVNQPQRGN